MRPVIASAYGTEDPGFESRPGVQFLGLYLICLFFNQCIQTFGVFICSDCRACSKRNSICNTYNVLLNMQFIIINNITPESVYAGTTYLLGIPYIIVYWLVCTSMITLRNVS
jgi:hypothetical protein